MLGYPGGGPLTSGAAAVRQVLVPVGRDIYGSGEVTRRLYELQADVAPGNSGGPFVLPNGKVAGVVFANSVVEDHVGYAIVSSEFAQLVTRSIAPRRGREPGPVHARLTGLTPRPARSPADLIPGSITRQPSGTASGSRGNARSVGPAPDTHTGTPASLERAEDLEHRRDEGEPGVLMEPVLERLAEERRVAGQRLDREGRVRHVEHRVLARDVSGERPARLGGGQPVARARARRDAGRGAGRAGGRSRPAARS